jgi:hypothetical protein
LKKIQRRFLVLFVLVLPLSIQNQEMSGWKKSQILSFSIVMQHGICDCSITNPLDTIILEANYLLFFVVLTYARADTRMKCLRRTLPSLRQHHSMWFNDTDASQYDGSQTIICDIKDLTESKFLTLLHDESFINFTIALLS